MKHSDFVQEIEKDPEYQEAKEALKALFALGDAVLRARIERGWSQTELARRVGTKQANISRIESGLGNPTFNLLQKILKVLDLEVHFIPSSTDPHFAGITYLRSASRQPTPVLRGTGVRVQALVVDAKQHGLSAEQLAQEYDLHPDQVREALSFYDAHRTEIELGNSGGR